MYRALIDACERGDCLTRDDALQVLDEKLPEEIWEAVRHAANRRMREISAGYGRLYASIGVDSAPCAMNCRFCSHGAAWGKANARWELTIEEVCERLRALLASDVPDWFTLRTTQHYGVDRLAKLCRAVRAELPVETELIVNTGEFTAADAQHLADAGVDRCYHTYRLREGADTGVRPKDRLATLSIIRDSPLALAALVEPLGPEHEDREIVDAAFRLKEYGVGLGGCMARVPVDGTPLAEHGMVSERRHVRVIAITRLISGPEVADICVHPPTGAALDAGANTVVVESGAIPRDAATEDDTWRHFGVTEARDMLRIHGFRARARTKKGAGDEPERYARVERVIEKQNR